MEIIANNGRVEIVPSDGSEREFVEGYLAYGLELIEAQSKLEETPDALKEDFKEAMSQTLAVLETDKIEIESESLRLLVESVKTFLEVAGEDETLKVKNFREKIISFSDGLLKIIKN